MKRRNRSGPLGDDGGDMNAEWSDHDIEMLLRGHVPASGDLVRLASVIRKLRARTQAEPTPASVAAMAALLADAARHPSSGDVRIRSGASRPAAAWRRRVGYSAIAAILASAGLAGTAAAADGSAPGDFAYGIDRALERIGIGNGGSHERLQEAEVLASRGEDDAALQHAAKALGSEGDTASSAALVRAAGAIAANGSENSAEVHARVSEMLTWMSTADPKGADFGQQVSAYARGLGEGAGSNANSGGDGSQTNSGKPDNPGNSGNAADPSNSGKPDSPGKSGDAGNSGNAGKPDKANTPSNPSEGAPASDNAD